MAFRHKLVTYDRYIRVVDQASAYAQITSDAIVLIMPQNTPKSLKFYCPCGCGELLTINLMPNVAKAWKIGFEVGKGFSLWPSVWRDTGCMSHFILRNNSAWLLLERRTDEASESFWDNFLKEVDPPA